MSLKTRRTLYYLLAVLFVIVSVSTVLYSGGFRLDLENRQIEKTGGIYLRSEPNETDITIDGGKVKNESGVFQSGTLITNLEPDTYKILISREGYHEWNKEAEVIPGEVSVFDGIFLVPKDASIKVAKTTDDFNIQNNRMLTNRNSVLRFEDKTIAGNEIVVFTENGTAVTFNRSNKNYYLSNIFDLSSSLNLNVTFNNMKQLQLGLPGEVPIKKILPYPYNDRKFIVMTGRALYALDTERLTVEQISPQANDFIISGNDAVWVGDSGIFSYSMILRSVSPVLGQNGIPADNISEIGASPSGNTMAILDTAGALSLFDTDTGTGTLVSNNAYKFLFSQDSRIITFAENDGTIHAYYLDEEKVRKKQHVVLRKSGQKVEKIMWHKSNNYIFVEDASGKLAFLEVSDSQPINETNIASNVKTFTYDNEFLYFDDGEAIWQLKI